MRDRRALLHRIKWRADNATAAILGDRRRGQSRAAAPGPAGTATSGGLGGRSTSPSMPKMTSRHCAWRYQPPSGAVSRGASGGDACGDGGDTLPGFVDLGFMRKRTAASTTSGARPSDCPGPSAARCRRRCRATGRRNTPSTGRHRAATWHTATDDQRALSQGCTSPPSPKSRSSDWSPSSLDVDRGTRVPGAADGSGSLVLRGHLPAQ